MLYTKYPNFMGANKINKIKSRPTPPPPQKKSFLAILGAFLLLFLHRGAFLLRFRETTIFSGYSNYLDLQ